VCAELDAVALQRAERLIGARAPHLKPAERRARAAALFAVKVGVLDVMSRLAPVAPPAAVLRELRQVLLAYLTRMEDEDHRTSPPRGAAKPAKSAAKSTPKRRR